MTITNITLTDGQKTTAKDELNSANRINSILTALVENTNASFSEAATAITDINTILGSDDTTLDDLQEVVSFIKANKDDLDNLAVANIAGLQDELTGITDRLDTIEGAIGVINSTDDTTDGSLIKLEKDIKAYADAEIAAASADQAENLGSAAQWGIE